MAWVGQGEGASPLSLEGVVLSRLVGLLTHRFILGPSSQIAVRFSDIVGVVNDYSGGAVPLQIQVDSLSVPETRFAFHTSGGNILGAVGL